jgi:hydrophobic/amphiphilic exporter-1 (mainly G- bacteria), HAE1 family
MVLANLMPGYSLGNIRVQIDNLLREQNVIPPGVRVSWFGEGEVMAREGVYMMQALLLSLILVYLLMVALFENWLYPFIIMFSQPQALVGALLALIVARSELNIVSMIGIIMLVGLVGKNAILLVDFTNTLRSRGLSREEALQQAGPIRLRPILMTTAALVLAMVPIALAVGRGSEFRAPLGIVIIGGMLVSTLLTLVVIPCMYTVMDDLTQNLRRLVAPRRAAVKQRVAGGE